MTVPKHLLLLAAGSGAGLLSGIALDRLYTRTTTTNNNNKKAEPLFKRPGLPIFGTVSAAVAVELAPPLTPPSIALPAKWPEKSLEIPPEPSPGVSRIGEIMRFGFPGLDNVRSRQDYVLSYDARNRNAHWVFEHLTKESVRKNEAVDRAKSEFCDDHSIHPYFRSTNFDYRGSGFDRGHLAAAGNHKLNQNVCDETFMLTNISPQVGVGFNRDKWEHLERYARGLTKLYRNVYICTGPLYLPTREMDGKKYVKFQVIGENHVAVPTHFFKVIVGETDNQQLEMEAYVLPNQPIPDNVALATFQVPPDAVERASGLLFFDKLSRHKLTRINGRVMK